MSKAPIRVMQIIDSLEIGGAERMAVNIANALPQDRVESYLCVTRNLGPLFSQVEPHVNVLCLKRRNRFDVIALLRLISFIRRNRIEILHAHGSSVFIASFLNLLFRESFLIWHIHNGNLEYLPKPNLFMWLYSRQSNYILVVNNALASWVTSHFDRSPNTVKYVPNFVSRSLNDTKGLNSDSTACIGGNTIVCVSNLRNPKDHISLIRAMAIVVKSFPARLLLVGAEKDIAYTQTVRDEVQRLELQDVVCFLGQRTDVPEILRSSTVGVLSSKSEGLPLALIEYGMAGLASVATRVGHCAEVLCNGEVGILVEPEDPEALADAIMLLLSDDKYRSELAMNFRRHVRNTYSTESVIGMLYDIYHSLM